MGFLLVLIGGIILTIGDLFMLKWVQTNAFSSYLYGMLIYIFSLNFLAYSFKFKNVAVASIIYVLINIITLLLVSWLAYGDKISLLKLIGIGVGLFAVILLEI